MRVRVALVAAAVLTLTAGCRETEWPSDAEPEVFCEDMLGTQFRESGIDELIVHHGTPANLPFEARRYLLDLEDGEADDPVGKQALDTYVVDYCAPSTSGRGSDGSSEATGSAT